MSSLEDKESYFCCVSETISVPLVHLLLHILCNLYIVFHEEVQQTLPYPLKLYPYESNYSIHHTGF